MLLRGFGKKKNPKIRDYYGSGWVGRGLSQFFFVENRLKIALISPKPVLIFRSSIPCVLHQLLKVVGYYDLQSVLSISAMGFQKKKIWMGVGGWGELYPILFGIFGIFLTLQIPYMCPPLETD